MGSAVGRKVKTEVGVRRGIPGMRVTGELRGGGEEEGLTADEVDGVGGVGRHCDGHLNFANGLREQEDKDSVQTLTRGQKTNGSRD